MALLLALTVAALTAGAPSPSRRPTAAAAAHPSGGAPAALSEAWAEAAGGGVVLGHSLQGRPIAAHDLGRGPDTTLIIATLHGDEWAGTPLVEALAEHLSARPAVLAGRRVVIVPVANPDGLADRRRGNLRGVDLNRNFPAANWRAGHAGGPAPLSEPESRAQAALIERLAPARIISIHQPLRRIDHDGPAHDLALAMGRVAPLPVRRIGGRPGSLGSWVGGTLGIPIVTLELPWRAERRPRAWLWARYGPALLAAIGSPARPTGLTAAR